MPVPATSCRRTGCLERPLCRALRALGALVGAHPWPFLLLPLVLSGGLATGFIYLSKREANDIEAHFMPQRGPAKGDRRFVQAHFPSHDADRFSFERLSTEGTFASILVVATGDTLLTRPVFAELFELDRAVRGFNTTDRTFAQLCARDSYGECNIPNPLVYILRRNLPLDIVEESLARFLRYPLARRGRLFMPTFFGGVELGEGTKQARPVRAVKAVRIIYYLQEDDAEQRNASDLWLRVFLNRIPDVLGSLNPKSFQVAYFTSLSIQEGFKRGDKLPVYITYILIVFFSVLSCARLDCVRTKVWVAAFGVVSSAFSMISSTGLLLFCKVPLVMTLANAPFLILGVGVDDMFILVSCWQRTQVKDSVKDRMAETYAAAAVPITISTLTNVLASCIGIATSFQSVRSFCLYTGTAFVFSYLYTLTFLGAILALNGKREKSNRHWLTFMKVATEPQDSHGRVYNTYCIGGSFDKSTGAEIEHPMDGFFRKHYGPFLMRTWTKVLVVVLYLLYLGCSIYGCTRVKKGIDPRNLVSDDSYLIQYYDGKEKYFAEYGPTVMVVVTKSIAYWDPSVREDLENCMESLENSSYIDKELSVSWLRKYESVAIYWQLNIDDKNFFIGNLSVLFRYSETYQWDINHTKTEIVTSRFFVQTVNVTTPDDESNLLRQLRGLAKKCKVPVIVYHPEFIYFDQYVEIIYNTIQTIVIATGAMLLISLRLLPNPLCSLWITFAIPSVIVGVIGFMTYWHVNLNSISMTYLVICIWFSVDFSAYVSYAFASSKEPKVNDKAVDALYRFGYPIVQGAVSTILGVAVLSVLDSYIFRTFFKIMFLVILFGAVHGLIFIPVFLTFLGFSVGLANG